MHETSTARLKLALSVLGLGFLIFALKTNEKPIFLPPRRLQFWSSFWRPFWDHFGVDFKPNFGPFWDDDDDDDEDDDDDDADDDHDVVCVAFTTKRNENACAYMSHVSEVSEPKHNVSN